MLIAAVQLNSGPELEKNLQNVLSWLRLAAEEGAELIAFPENCLYFGNDHDDVRPRLELDGPELKTLQLAASQYNVELLLGSIPEKIPHENQTYNTSILIYPASPGRPIPPPQVIYRKLHLFDVILESGESHQESLRCRAGDQVVVAHSRCGTLGMSICYDLRFPELYRSLINLGAELIAVPAAFTYETGKDHWFPLLKARAIENLAYLIAPAQAGTAYPGRRCYGNSLILDPWGNILAHRPEESEGAIFAEINHDYQRHIRQRFPVLKHRKLFTERL